MDEFNRLADQQMREYNRLADQQMREYNRAADQRVREYNRAADQRVDEALKKMDDHPQKQRGLPHQRRPGLGGLLRRVSPARDEGGARH